MMVVVVGTVVGVVVGVGLDVVGDPLVLVVVDGCGVMIT